MELSPFFIGDRHDTIKSFLSQRAAPGKSCREKNRLPDKFYGILSLIFMSTDLFGKIFQHFVAHVGAVFHQVDHLHDALTILIKLIFNLKTRQKRRTIAGKNPV